MVDVHIVHEGDVVIYVRLVTGLEPVKLVGIVDAIVGDVVSLGLEGGVTQPVSIRRCWRFMQRIPEAVLGRLAFYALHGTRAEARCVAQAFEDSCDLQSQDVTEHNDEAYAAYLALCEERGVVPTV